jgi:hypothetical protein
VNPRSEETLLVFAQSSDVVLLKRFPDLDRFYWHSAVASTRSRECTRLAGFVVLTCGKLFPFHEVFGV